jgi:short-subunit dehydrogenase
MVWALDGCRFHPEPHSRSERPEQRVWFASWRETLTDMPSTALITGASSGIGRALAQQFAAHGYDLILVSRNSQARDEVARSVSTRVHHLSADLSSPHAAAAVVEAARQLGPIDVVVNNAGFGLRGDFAELPLERQLEMIHLNVVALTELTRLLLPDMLARRRGGVLNVASTAAFQPGPLMAVYYATKAYVLSFTEAIAEEVSGSGLKVSCLCPGPTATGFAAQARMTDTNVFAGAVMEAGRVAQEGFDGWSAGQVTVVPGFSNRRGAFLVRLAPRAMVRRIVKRLNSSTA